MSVALETKPTSKGNEQYPIADYLRTCFECLVSPSTTIVEAYLQFNELQNLSKSQLPRQIQLHQKQTSLPLTRHSYPVIYQRKEVGTLHLLTPHQDCSAPQSIKLAQIEHKKLTRAISLLLKRHQAASLSSHYLGKTFALSGYSEEAFKLDSFIEKAANAFCPVVICGEVGSEKLSVASAIHYNSDLKHQPFIEINCSTPSAEEFQSKIKQSYQQANGGCLFFNAIDDLSPAQQGILADALAINSSSAPLGIQSDKNRRPVRIFASTTKALQPMVEAREFSRELFEKLNFLTIQIPSLCSRKEDIPYILQNLVHRYHLFPEQEFSNEAKQALYDYNWPQNYCEIEQTTARLLTLSTANPITLTDIKQYSPEVLSPSTSICNSLINSESVKTFDLIATLQQGDYQQFNHLHRGLQKALTFIAENYIEQITLGDLSEHVHISQSHLSFLFKQNVKKTIKQIISELRIAKAKEMIEASPQLLITQIALDVGFGDLSHFEKMFKRYTGITPRGYKSLVKKKQAIAA